MLSRLGRIIRDIGRKIAGNTDLEAIFTRPLTRAAQIRGQQQRQRGWLRASGNGPRRSHLKNLGFAPLRNPHVTHTALKCLQFRQTANLWN